MLIKIIPFWNIIFPRQSGNLSWSKSYWLSVHCRTFLQYVLNIFMVETWIHQWPSFHKHLNMLKLCNDLSQRHPMKAWTPKRSQIFVFTDLTCFLMNIFSILVTVVNLHVGNYWLWPVHVKKLSRIPIFKPPFAQFQRWSVIRTLDKEKEGK